MRYKRERKYAHKKRAAMLQPRTFHIKKEQLCTYNKSSCATIRNFSAYKNIFGGLTYYYINMKGNDRYERKKIYKIQS